MQHHVRKLCRSAFFLFLQCKVHIAIGKQFCQLQTTPLWEIAPALSLKTGQCSSVMAPSAPKVPSFSFHSTLVILGGRPTFLSNDVGHPASGLAFGHSVCNQESSASSRTSFTTCH